MEEAETIRSAHIAEKPELEALQMRASLMWEEDREMLIRHPEAVSIPIAQFTSGMVLVATRGEAIVGFAALEPRPDGGAELDGLFVEPDWWKQGIGSRLMLAAETLAASRGNTHVHLIANPRAQNFYERCGYTVVGTTDQTWRLAALMSKRLLGCTSATHPFPAFDTSHH